MQCAPTRWPHTPPCSGAIAWPQVKLQGVKSSSTMPPLLLGNPGPRHGMYSRRGDAQAEDSVHSLVGGSEMVARRAPRVKSTANSVSVSPLEPATTTVDWGTRVHASMSLQRTVTECPTGSSLGKERRVS